MKNLFLKLWVACLFVGVAACEKPNAEKNEPSTEKNEPSTEKPGLLAGVTIKLNFDEDKVTATTAQADYSIDFGAASGVPIDVKIKYSIAESLNEGSSSTYVKTLDKSASYVVLDGLLFDRIYYYEVYTELYGTKYTSGKGTFKTSAVSVAMNDPRETDEGLVLSGKVQGVAQEDKQQLGVYLCFNEAGYSDKVQRFDLDVPESNEIEVLIPGLNIATDYEYWWVIWDDETKTEKGDKLTYTTNDPYAQPKEVSAAGTDLSADGTANCYIVPASGAYKFKMTKGNSSESVGNVASVRILWESFGTAEAPRPFDLISAAGMDGEYALFEVPQDYKEGNAVIAAYNSEGVILWSWHIWLTNDQMTPDTYYVYRQATTTEENGGFTNEIAGVVMDRNLGALSSEVNSLEAFGLFYQWGRKDPFLGSANLAGTMYARSTRNLKVAAPVEAIQNVEFAIANPHVFILGNEKRKDWMSQKDNNLWTNSSKTKYDPCPAGWRIPDGGTGVNGVQAGLWAKIGMHVYGKTSMPSSWQSGWKGMKFPISENGFSSWYPVAGGIGLEAQLKLIGVDGTYWTAAAIGGDHDYVYAMNFYFTSSQTEYYAYNGAEIPRATGNSVRCCKE